MDYLKRNFAAQVGVERLVSDAHGAAPEFDWLAVTAVDELILVETLWSAYLIEISRAQRGV
jgi:hypothetical protein